MGLGQGSNMASWSTWLEMDIEGHGVSIGLSLRHETDMEFSKFVRARIKGNCLKDVYQLLR